VRATVGALIPLPILLFRQVLTINRKFAGLIPVDLPSNSGDNMLRLGILTVNENQNSRSRRR
jgi:hypothetical protein